MKSHIKPEHCEQFNEMQENHVCISNIPSGANKFTKKFSSIKTSLLKNLCIPDIL
jgi:hypothetical protein